MFNKSSTFILKSALVFMGIVVLLLSIFFLPSAWVNGPLELPPAAIAIRMIIAGMYATTIPFYVALYQTFKLLQHIDKNTAFSEASVHALTTIKRCAGIIAALYIGGVPLLYPIAEADDAPGVILFGFLFACGPVVVTVFAAVLARLLRSAIDIKSENDLTV